MKNFITFIILFLSINISTKAQESDLMFAMNSIKSFVAERPNAADTLEGIHYFWIQWDRPIPEMSVTLHALDLLADDEIMEERELGDQIIWRACRVTN